MILVILILIFIIVFNSIQPTYEPLEDYMGPLNTEILKTCLKHPEYEEGDVSCGFMKEVFVGNSLNQDDFHKLSNQKFYSDREIVNDLKYFNNANSLINYNRDNIGNTPTNEPRFTEFLPEIVPGDMYDRLTLDVSHADIDASINNVSNQIFYIEQKLPKLKEQIINNTDDYNLLNKTLVDKEINYDKLRFKQNFDNSYLERYFNRYLDNIYYSKDTKNMISLLGNLIAFQSYIQDVENNTYDESTTMTMEEINEVLDEKSQISYSYDNKIPEKIKDLKDIGKVIVMYLSSIEESYNKLIQQKMIDLNREKQGLLDDKESQTLTSLTGKYSQNYFLSNLRKPGTDDYDSSGAEIDFKWFNNASAIYSGYIKEGKLSAM